MKKFAIGALTALVATLSIASTADAGWRHRHNHGWRHHGHYGVVIRAPRVYHYGHCWKQKVVRYDRWGNAYFKRVRVCG